MLSSILCSVDMKNGISPNNGSESLHNELHSNRPFHFVTNVTPTFPLCVFAVCIWLDIAFVACVRERETRTNCYLVVNEVQDLFIHFPATCRLIVRSVVEISPGLQAVGGVIGM